MGCCSPFKILWAGRICHEVVSHGVFCCIMNLILGLEKNALGVSRCNAQLNISLIALNYLGVEACDAQLYGALLLHPSHPPLFESSIPEHSSSCSFDRATTLLMVNFVERVCKK